MRAVDFDQVKPGLRRTPRGVHKTADDEFNIPGVKHHGVIERSVAGHKRNQRHGVMRYGGMGQSARVVELHSRPAACGVNGVCQSAQPLDVAVVIYIHAGIIRTSGRVDAGSFKHVKPNAASGPRLVIAQQAFTHLPVAAGVTGDHGRQNDPVPETCSVDSDGRQHM